MTRGPVNLSGFQRGLYLPDSGADMPENSLAVATNADVTKNGTVRQRFGTRNCSTTSSGEPTMT